MAKFKIQITEHEDIKKSSSVTLTMTNDVSDSIIKYMKEVFELEMLTANIRCKGINTIVKFSTKNHERIVMLRQGVISYYFESTNGRNDN